MAKLPSEEQLKAAENALTSYHLALGKVAHAWNIMQEQLGMLFCEVAGLDRTMGMGIWHALKSDRTQRDLLEAALTAASRNEEWSRRFPKAKSEIEWILWKIKARAEDRNSAIHAPVSVPFGSTEATVKPLMWNGNPLARNLGDKDILAEFEWYVAYFRAIRMYAGQITHYLCGGAAWPDRPTLPTVKQRSGPQDHSHQSSPK